MYERYSEQARRVLYIARHEAHRAGSPMADAEHVLLGLLESESSAAHETLAKAGLRSSLVRQEFEGSAHLSSSPERPHVPVWSRDARLLIEKYAPEECDRLGTLQVSPEHLLLGLMRLEDSPVAKLLLRHGLRPEALRERLLMGTRRAKPERVREDRVSIEEFTQDLTALAEAGELDPLVGRLEELDRAIQILARRHKNNPILLGEPGVGKTALVEGLAQRIADGLVPSTLQGKRILTLDLSLVLAGTKYRGQFEERLKGILREAAEDRSIILFIDEIHTMVGTGSAEGSLDAASILKPALSRGQVQCIGTSTFRDYKRHIEKDRALVRRFQPVQVLPPSEAETLKILEGLRDRYQSFHGVTFTDEALREAVRLSSRYISDRFLPDKAVDVLDEAGAKAKILFRDGDAAPRVEVEVVDLPGPRRQGVPPVGPPETPAERPRVGRTQIEEVVALWTGIPVTAIREDERDKLLRIEETLHRRVIGQAPAIAALARAIRRSRAGIKNPNRPIGSFIFLGPTGVGKTEAAKTLTEYLFGDEKAMIRLDMSEYAERHSVSKMIGSPPGYVGFEEGGQLVERVKRRPYAVILLDEIEKAHPEVLNMLLQILEDGILTDSYGETVDFKNTILILTSNLGSKFVLDRGVMGFETVEERVASVKAEEVHRLLRRTLLPEFLNRIDEIIIFDALSRTDLLAIADKMVTDLNEMLRDKGIVLEPEPGVAEFLVSHCCSDPSFGARPLRRGVQTHIEDPLAEWLLANPVAGEVRLALAVVDGRVALTQLDPVSISW